MKKKKELKKKDALKHIFISDDLTRLRGKLVQAMRQDDGIVKVWTVDGKIFFVVKRGNKEEKKMLDSIDDVIELGWDETKLRDVGLFLEY